MHDLLAYMAAELPAINAELARGVAQADGYVRPLLEHVLMAGGKRLRPVLTLLSARALGLPREDAAITPLAVCLEYLHTATLLHDDILDGAEVRRGLPSAHTLHGDKKTILAGDYLLALGNRIVARHGDPRMTETISEAILRTAAGEVAEIAHAGDAALTRETYLSIITGKTACLIQAACRLGAQAAKATDDQIEAISSYGMNIGIAFQLVDDALDYSATSEVAGKPVGADLLEGKLTLPLLFYLETLDDAERARLGKQLAEGSLSVEDASRIVSRVREEGFDAATRHAAAAYLSQAADALGTLPPSTERELLRHVMDYIRTREK